nr:Rpn family recombination-promoting nuclease/putative transposase [uncultured Acetatifactor sp.]
MKQTKKRNKKIRKKRGPVTSAVPGLHRAAEPRDMVLNSRIRDSSSKVIFDDPTLCSQFLRDYVDLPCLKDVKPEDIEDVSEQYVTLFAEERNSDRVKRVHIEGGTVPFFLVSLIEHKTAPDYNVCMQVFRYMVYIWNAYEKEAESIRKGMSRREDFLYPPVLPIIYYEGAGKWHVPLDFKSRVREGEAFGKYLPDFTYYLVPLRDYSNEALMEKRDEISLVMLINKLQTAEDIENFRRLPGSEIEAILRDSLGHLVDVIADVLCAFLLKMNVPVPETERLTDKVREKKMGELFADMEKMDIQAERRKTEAERTRADEEKRRADTAEENSVKLLVELCQELGASKDAAVQSLMDKKNMGPGEAWEKTGLYWKDSSKS